MTKLNLKIFNRRRGRCGGGGCGGNKKGNGGGGAGGGKGQCNSASDCPAYAPICSKWGYCQTNDQPDGDPNAGKCSSSSDCPNWAPTCSKWGYCQESGI